MELKVGATAYIIESNCMIREVTIFQKGAEFSIARYGDGRGIRIRNNRFFPTEEEAKQHLAELKARTRKSVPHSF